VARRAPWEGSAVTYSGAVPQKSDATDRLYGARPPPPLPLPLVLPLVLLLLLLLVLLLLLLVLPAQRQAV
jgi:hypothetical protein